MLHIFTRLILITRLTAACDKVYQLLAHGWWFFPGIYTEDPRAT